MNKKTFQDILKAGLFAGDAVIIAVSVLLAYYLRFYVKLVPLKYGIPPVTDYVFAIPVMLAIFLLAFNYAGLYRIERGRSRIDESIAAFLSVSAGIILLISFTFFFREVSYSRIVIMHLWALCSILIVLWRLLYRSIYLSLSRNELIIPRIIIIGATEVSRMLIERLKRQHDNGGYSIVGVLDDRLKKGRKFCGEAVLGKIKELTALAEEQKVDEVFMGLSDYDRRRVADIILQNDRVRFLIASDIMGILTKAVDYGELYGIPVFSVKDLPLNSPWNRFVKRAFDIVFSLTAIIALSPFLLAIALLVKVTSKGPVLYGQERLSRGNKPFIMLKFRTMKEDAEKKSGPVWAKAGDPRRTPIGTFLRKTSIDELPQLFNVLKGDISMIGPRSERPHFVAKFKEEIPRYIERHRVKGGLSGWAQVNGLRGDTSLEERVKYDLYYIENWSLWFDIKIIIKTVLEIFHHTTAY